MSRLTPATSRSIGATGRTRLTQESSWTHSPRYGTANQARHTYVADGRPVGFFTDPTVCIGCKACEVACKEWNDVPEDGLVWSGHSYDNSARPGCLNVEAREVPRVGSAAGFSGCRTHVERIW